MIVLNQEFLAVLANCALSLPAKAALYVLRHHQNPHTGQCNPRRETLAGEMCVSLATVRRAIAELKKTGMIQVKATGRSSEYQILTKAFVLKGQVDPSEGSNRPLRRVKLTSQASPPPYSSERKLFKEEKESAPRAREVPPSKQNLSELCRDLLEAHPCQHRPLEAEEKLQDALQAVSADVIRNRHRLWLEVWKHRLAANPNAYVPPLSDWFSSGDWLLVPTRPPANTLAEALARGLEKEKAREKAKGAGA